MQFSARNNYRFASLTSFAAGMSMVVMLCIMSIYPYANPLHFEGVQSVDQLVQNLIRAGIPLRIVMTIDHMFLIFLASAFLFAIAAVRNDSNRFVTGLISVPVILTALLDIYENHHIAVMLMSVLEGLPITRAEISQQAILSLSKFHIGNLNYFLLAFFLPHETKLEKGFRYALLFALLPLSVIRYSFADIMGVSIMPYVPVAVGLLIASYIFMKRSRA